MDEEITVADAAEILQRTIRHTRGLYVRGHLVGRRIGEGKRSIILLSRQSVESYVPDRRGPKPKPKPSPPARSDTKAKRRRKAKGG